MAVMMALIDVFLFCVIKREKNVSTNKKDTVTTKGAGTNKKTLRLQRVLVYFLRLYKWWLLLSIHWLLSTRNRSSLNSNRRLRSLYRHCNCYCNRWLRRFDHDRTTSCESCLILFAHVIADCPKAKYDENRHHNNDDYCYTLSRVVFILVLPVNVLSVCSSSKSREIGYVRPPRASFWNKKQKKCQNTH